MSGVGASGTGSTGGGGEVSSRELSKAFIDIEVQTPEGRVIKPIRLDKLKQLAKSMHSDKGNEIAAQVDEVYRQMSSSFRGQAGALKAHTSAGSSISRMVSGSTGSGDTASRIESATVRSFESLFNDLKRFALDNKDSPTLQATDVYTDLDHTRGENIQLRRQVIEQGIENAQQRATITGLESEVEALTVQKDALVAHLETTVVQFTQQIEQLKATIAEKSGKIDEQQAHIEELESQVQQLERTVGTQEAHLSKVNERLKQARGVIRDLRADKAGLETDLAEAKEAHRLEKEELEGQIGDLEGRIGALEEENRGLREEVAALTRKVAAREATLARTEGQLGGALEVLKDIDERVETALIDIQRLENEIAACPDEEAEPKAELERQKLEAQVRLDELQRPLNAARDKINTLTAESAEKTVEIERLRTELRALEMSSQVAKPVEGAHYDRLKAQFNAKTRMNPDYSRVPGEVGKCAVAAQIRSGGGVKLSEYWEELNKFEEAGYDADKRERLLNEMGDYFKTRYKAAVTRAREGGANPATSEAVQTLKMGFLLAGLDALKVYSSSKAVSSIDPGAIFESHIRKGQASFVAAEKPKKSQAFSTNMTIMMKKVMIKYAEENGKMPTPAELKTIFDQVKGAGGPRADNDLEAMVHQIIKTEFYGGGAQAVSSWIRARTTTALPPEIEGFVNEKRATSSNTDLSYAVDGIGRENVIVTGESVSSNAAGDVSHFQAVYALALHALNTERQQAESFEKAEYARVAPRLHDYLAGIPARA